MSSTVQVRYFASLVDRTGCREESVSVDAGCDVRQLWESLVERHPALANLGFEPRVACDQEFADWQRLISGVREVSFLPPFSGG